MDLPVIPTPIFPRWLWMEEVTFSHIPIAAIITAYMFLAPILEWVGYRKRDLRYDRLSKNMVYFSMILFSPGAALGTGIPFFIIGLYPEFWARWANIFFWPLIAQFVLFMFEVAFLFNFYYLTWDRMMHRKRRHILYGFIAASMGELIQFIWDAIGSYMLTPGGVGFPMITQPMGFSLQGFFNPSFISLFLHRSFGNLSWTCLIAGGIFAIRSVLNRLPKEREYYGFAADLTFTLGFLFFFAQPLIGWGYARVLQRWAPVAFHTVMGGHAYYYWLPKMALMILFVVIAAIYVFIRHREKLWLLGAISAGFVVIYTFLFRHPPLRWFSGAASWRLTTGAIFAGLLAVLWLLRWQGHRLRIRGWQVAVFIAGIASFLVFAAGGNIRERVRQPHTVYGQLEKPEVLEGERDRFVTYEKCVECHHRSERRLVLPKGETWAQRVAVERRRPGVSLSDEDAARVVRYLEEARP